ncbi:Spectrin beta chain [Dirofilaria immitis]
MSHECNCFLHFIIGIQYSAMTTDIAVRGHDYNGRIEDYEEYDENSSARLFERSRIKALADERENVQKKTFTKWTSRSAIWRTIDFRITATARAN